jgi:hypothetical protein
VALLTSFTSSAQRIKVKRKGVKLIDVTKPSSNASRYSLSQFAGKWQEILRRNRSNNFETEFTDTLFLNFYGDEVSIRNGKGLSFKGTAEIEPGNMLSAAGDEFIIKSIDKSKAVLDDGDKYIHTLTKKKNFWYETLPTDSIVPEKLTTPISISLSSVYGKWIVYRRDAKPGVTSSEALIKTITIESNSDSAFNGQVTFYQDEKTETLPCSVTIEGTKLNIGTTEHSWQTDVYKASEQELVFGTQTLMYYTKRLQ